MTAAFQRSAVSRADLARLLAALPPERVASAATSLGFERIREPDPDITIVWIDPDELDQDGPVVAELLGKTNQRFPETSQRNGVRWPHWRLETMQFETGADRIRRRSTQRPGIVGQGYARRRSFLVCNASAHVLDLVVASLAASSCCVAIDDAESRARRDGIHSRARAWRIDGAHSVHAATRVGPSVFPLDRS